MTALAVVGGLVVCAALGGFIGSYRGRGGMGFALGLLLGPLGVLIACLLPPDYSPPVQRPAKPHDPLLPRLLGALGGDVKPPRDKDRP